MRTVAAYAFESHGSAVEKFNEVIVSVEHWLREKGWVANSTGDFQNDQGNLSRVLRVDLEPLSGNLSRFVVMEKQQESIFSTELSVACDDDVCAVFVELRVEGTGPRLEPFRFDARRPKFIGRLLHDDLSWQLGETPLTDRVYEFHGTVGGRRVTEVLWHPDRVVPVVMLSLVAGQGITSNFATKLAGDLAGLAIVATVDEEASWILTRSKGAEWSCFNGALRLYWPFGRVRTQPKLHPLWLRTTILGGGIDPGNASYRMRAQLRRIILGASALSIREPVIIRRLAREAREKRQDDLRKAFEGSSGVDEYRAIAESYAIENDRLREEIKESEDRISALEGQVSELQLALRYIPDDEAAIPPDVERDPETVRDAVAAARNKFSDRLIFPDLIEEGLETLNPDAGPPAKLFRYLQSLSDLARAREAGALGKV